MTDRNLTDRFRLGSFTVRRLGYGAMQLAGPNAFGPPQDRQAAVAVLREAVARGVDHIDTSDLYGPRVTNEIIREALWPYPDGLVIATKVGMRRGATGSWEPAESAADITRAVYDDLRVLGRDVLDVVYFRASAGASGPAAQGSVEAPLAALAELQHRGLVRHIGLSNVTADQIAAGRRLVELVGVQNHYNLAHRHDDTIVDALAGLGIAYVPFFPLGGFTPLQSRALAAVAARHGAKPLQVALAWLLRRAPNVLPIPGTSSVAHLAENLASASIPLSAEDLAALEGRAA